MTNTMHASALPYTLTDPRAELLALYEERHSVHNAIDAEIMEAIADELDEENIDADYIENITGDLALYREALAMFWDHPAVVKVDERVEECVTKHEDYFRALLETLSTTDSSIYNCYAWALRMGREYWIQVLERALTNPRGYFTVSLQGDKPA
ncbi:hypothetical protein AGMMS49992_14820 [Clostridia bacterium]|nr:hypothetical protein AGMMS49992_14820 [Clostridia bacterium]